VPKNQSIGSHRRLIHSALQPGHRLLKNRNAHPIINATGSHRQQQSRPHRYGTFSPVLSDSIQTSTAKRTYVCTHRFVDTIRSLRAGILFIPNEAPVIPLTALCAQPSFRAEHVLHQNGHSIVASSFHHRQNIAPSTVISLSKTALVP